MRFVVKISAETFIKSRSVRTWHMKQLRRNITRVLSEIDPKVNVRSLWDRLEVACTEQTESACRERLRDIPGISHIHTVDSYELPSENPVEFLMQKSIEYFAQSLTGKSFAVRCKREGIHTFRSIDVNRHVGAALLQNSAGSRVQLKDPDVTVSMEILHERVYFVRDTTPGLKGYTYGTQGSVLSLISGGFDSSVATYQMMRRGCRVNFLFFNLGGAAHSLGVQQAALYLWQKFGSSHSARFYSVPLDALVADLMALPNSTFNGVLLKRAMIKVANDIAERIKVDAFVTGECLSQVSSQTLANLSVIDRATETLIVRPLITTEKTDIIAIAEEIGTAVFARDMVEYCGVISNKPTISASLEKLQELEHAMGEQWFDNAIERMENIAVGDIIELLNKKPKVELVQKIEEELLIDIRATDSTHEKSDLHIPFHQLNQAFPKLAQDKNYLLYCDKGVMSQLHAAYLHENGFNNVKVYRPLDDLKANTAEQTLAI